MNILEILWVILNILGVFYSVKLFKEDSDYSDIVIIFTIWSIFVSLAHFSEALTTPLW